MVAVGIDHADLQIPCVCSGLFYIDTNGVLPAGAKLGDVLYEDVDAPGSGFEYLIFALPVDGIRSTVRKWKRGVYS